MSTEVDGPSTATCPYTHRKILDELAVDRGFYRLYECRNGRLVLEHEGDGVFLSRALDPPSPSKHWRWRLRLLDDRVHAQASNGDGCWVPVMSVSASRPVPAAEVLQASLR